MERRGHIRPQHAARSVRFGRLGDGLGVGDGDEEGLTSGWHRLPGGPPGADHGEPDAAFGHLAEVVVSVAAGHARTGGDVVDGRAVLADVLEVVIMA